MRPPIGAANINSLDTLFILIIHIYVFHMTLRTYSYIITDPQIHLMGSLSFKVQ